MIGDICPKKYGVIFLCTKNVKIYLDLAVWCYCLQELLDKTQRAKMYERLRYLEKSMLFELCGTLFDDKHKSVWSGPHSLVKREDATRRSSIMDAVTTFMK